MSRIIKPRPWNVRRGLVAPRWRNIWDELQFALLLNQRVLIERDLVERVYPIDINTASLSIQQGRHGPKIVGGWDGSSELGYYFRQPPYTDYPFTISAMLGGGDAGSNGFNGAVDATDQSGPEQNAALGHDAGGRAIMAHRNGTNFSSGWVTGTTVIEDGGVHLVNGVFVSATLRQIYVDGRLEGEGTFDGGACMTPVVLMLGHLDDSTPSNPYGSGHIGGVWVHSRDLRPAEIARWAADPFAPFRPARRVVVRVAGADITVEPGLCQVAITGLAPTVTATANVSVSPAQAEISLTGLAPTIAVSGNQTVEPAQAEISLTGLAPTVTASDHQTVAPAQAEVTLTGLAPTVTASDHQTVAPAQAEITFAAYSPTVTVSDLQVVQPGTSAVVLAGFEPSIVTTAHVTVTPGPSTVAISCYSPLVANTGLAAGSGEANQGDDFGIDLGL